MADLYDPTGDRVFGYDDLDRLIHAEGAWGVLDYTYDKTGNRLTRTADGQAGTYVYQPGTSRLLSVDEVFPAQHQYGYDDAGRVVSADNLILAYNAAGRLSSVVQTFPLDQTPFGLYTYNALGERVKKTAGAATTVYHYDRDGRLIAESDPSGRFGRTYVYLGDERLAAYEPVGLSQTIEALRVLSGEETAGAKDLDGDGRLGAADALAGLQMVAGVRPLPGDLAYYFVNDHLGTPVKVVNQAGIVVWGGTTLPFGAVEGGSRVFDNRFRFPGQYFDAETGLHYNYHRYYDPTIGRYTTPDPIGLDGGINLFTYSNNSPINLIDPLGLAWYGNFLGPVDQGDLSPYGNKGINPLDEAARLHDISYSKIAAKGPVSALFDKDTIIADAQLSIRAIKATISTNSGMGFSDRLVGLGTAISFGAITMTKTISYVLKSAILGGDIESAKRTLKCK